MIKRLLVLIPAGVAALLAALVSLPLDSPDDAFLNTGTVTIAALLVGIALGIVWQMVSNRPNAQVIYLAVAAAGFVAAIIFVVVMESQLSGMVRFGLPLAAIIFGIAGVLTPIIASMKMPDRLTLLAGPAMFAVALAVGIGLSGVGDAESGKLSLPESPDPTADAQVLTTDDIAGVAFSVVPGESQLTYTVREKLAFLPNSSDAVGRTSDLNGEVYLDGTASTVSADMTSLASDQDRRDQFVQQNIFSADPVVTFVVDDLSQLALPAQYTSGETFTATLTGTATVTGVSRPTTFAVEANYDGSTLNVLGTTDFVWSDFNITPPNTPVVTVEDNVHIEVLIVARSPLST